MRTFFFSVFILSLTACNVLPVQYQDGAHWAMLENPLSQKCVEARVDEGTIEMTGLMTYLQGLTVTGKGIDYKSYGKMCANVPVTP